VSFVLHKFDRGGSLRVAAYLARGLTDLGFKVDLILFTSRGEVDKIITELAGSEVPIRYLGAWSGPRSLDLVRGFTALVRMLRRQAPDTIIAGANNVALVSALAKWVAGLRTSRLFVKTTNPIATSRHTGLIKAIRRWAYRKVFSVSTGVWTLSPSETDEMRIAFPNFATLFRDVLNPYVTPRMLNRSAITGSVDDLPFILAVGRLTRQKRLERLIEAFALISDKTVRLRILGEGEQRHELTVLIERLGLRDRVDLPGYVKDVAGAYEGARMVVLTSDYEGLPAVVLEAMAANCPILSTDCFPAARAILEDAEGCEIIERTDPTTLAGMIDAHLLLPRPTRLREIAQRYSIENGIASHVAAMTNGPIE
jgi:glycosyltransferase involved in cell wall biosynthesis